MAYKSPTLEELLTALDVARREGHIIGGMARVYRLLVLQYFKGGEHDGDMASDELLQLYCGAEEESAEEPPNLENEREHFSVRGTSSDDGGPVRVRCHVAEETLPSEASPLPPAELQHSFPRRAD